MPPKYKRFTADQIIHILKRNNFEKISQKGSHQKWRNSYTGHQVIIPYHKGIQLPMGTLKSIIEGSGLDSSLFEN